jgi:hypothetical protein
MHARGILIISILVLVIGLICSGCTSTAPTTVQNSTPVNQGQAKVSLQQAIDALDVSARNDGFTSSPGIYYIRAVNLTPNATAEEWTIGAMQGNSTYFFTFSGQGGSRTDWPEQFPYQEIIQGQYMQPNALFQNHKLLIQDITQSGTIDISELELENGVYTIIMDSGTDFKVFTFDAATGREL